MLTILDDHSRAVLAAVVANAEDNEGAIRGFEKAVLMWASPTASSTTVAQPSTRTSSAKAWRQSAYTEASSRPRAQSGRLDFLAAGGRAFFIGKAVEHLETAPEMRLRPVLVRKRPRAGEPDRDASAHAPARS